MKRVLFIIETLRGGGAERALSNIVMHFPDDWCVDILINDKTSVRKKVRDNYHLPQNAKILMYAPTFRGGSQETERSIQVGQNFPDYQQIICALEKKISSPWYIFLRLHPQLVARDLDRKMMKETNKSIIDVSRVDDMYEILAGCDAFMTDYSSAAFDAALMKFPVFLYVDDYKMYEKERGKLLWNLSELPFPYAINDEELIREIENFEESNYINQLDTLFQKINLKEDGKAAAHVVDFIRKLT